MISQAVLVSPDGSETNLCSREVTENNWNVNQMVAVAAKVDFKYDGTQYRNMTIWVRKVDASGQTIERRSIKIYRVGFDRI